MKDFYDVYMLSKTNKFNIEQLRVAVRNTFKRRGTNLPDGIPFIFTPDFYEDAQRQKQWLAFLRKLNLEYVEENFEI